MIDVHDLEVRTDSRAIVDQLRNKLRSTLRFRIAHGSIPVQDAGAVRVGIEVALQMRKDALSGDYVRNTVAIEIAKGHAMQLRKGHISGVFRRKIAHNGMLYEGNGAVLVALLLEPCESPSVSVKHRYDVVQAVTVHVSNPHAVPAHEALFRDLVHDPGGGGVFRIGLGVLHGAIAAEQNCGFSVAIDVF